MVQKVNSKLLQEKSNVGCGEGAGCWNATWAKNIVNRGCWIVVAGPKCRYRKTPNVIVAFDWGSNLLPLLGSSWGSSCWFSTVVTTLGRRARNFTKLQSLSSYLLQKRWPEQLQEKWPWTWNSCSLLNHAICFLWASSLGNLTSPCCSTYPKNFTLLCFLVHPSPFSTSDSRNKLFWSWFKLSLLVSFYFQFPSWSTASPPASSSLLSLAPECFLEPLLAHLCNRKKKL